MAALGWTAGGGRRSSACRPLLRFLCTQVFLFLSGCHGRPGQLTLLAPWRDCSTWRPPALRLLSVRPAHPPACRLSEIQQVAGRAAPNQELLDRLVAGDFDPEEYDRMAAAFGDDYYQVEKCISVAWSWVPWSSSSSRWSGSLQMVVLAAGGVLRGASRCTGRGLWAAGRQGAGYVRPDVV